MGCDNRCFEKESKDYGHDECGTCLGRDNGPTAKRSPCPCPEVMGEFACQDKTQCWEPCGELGKSEAHAVVADEVPNLKLSERE